MTAIIDQVMISNKNGFVMQQEPQCLTWNMEDG